jgi:hypothetical protein
MEKRCFVSGLHSSDFLEIRFVFKPSIKTRQHDTNIVNLGPLDPLVSYIRQSHLKIGDLIFKNSEPKLGHIWKANTVQKFVFS